MKTYTPIIAIVGRTNVGKSSLFNALLKKKQAVVASSPAVTRDRHYALVTGYDFPFTLIDTGGFVEKGGEGYEGSLSEMVIRQTKLAIEESDLVMAVFDGVSGVQPLDRKVVDILRKANKKTIWVVNKCENDITEILAGEFYALGIKSFVCVSAAHRQGLDNLVGLVEDQVEKKEEDKEEDTVDSIRVALVGKPNVGKSSLANALIGKERLIISETAGTTRDSVDVEIEREGQKYTLIDTAGLRKKHKVEPSTIEQFSNLRAIRVISSCDVSILVLDATQGAPSDQDKTIAELIHERGKGFVIAVNKWDAIEKEHTSVQEFKTVIQKEFSFARYAPILFISALTGRRCFGLLDKAKEIHETSKTRISTSSLNKILSRAFQSNQPQSYHGGPIKLFFATQAETSPPTIVLFLNHPRGLGEGYLRYLKREVRKEFSFEGTDIKFVLRKRRSNEEGGDKED